MAHTLTRPLALVGLVVAGQVADLLTFALAVERVGINGELNGMAADLYAAFGFAGVAAFKLGLTALVVAACLWMIRPASTHRPSLAGRAMLLATAIGLLGAATNLAALL
jgi:hypothetical protein